MLGSPGGTRGKEPPCQYRRHKRRWFSPWVGRSPGRGQGSPLQCSCLETPTDRGAWRATAHVVTEADVTEGTSRETCQPFPFWLSGFDVSLALRPQPTIVTCSLRPPLGLCSLSMPVRSIWGLFWWQFVFPQWQPLVLAGWFSYF